MLAILIAGFTLGFAGSLHCVGMCGPLSLALPTLHLSPGVKFFSLLLYQAGRVFTYSILGLLFGLAGRTIYIAGFQQWFSIGIGIVILVTAAFYFLQKHTVHFRVFSRWYATLQQLIGNLLRRNNGPGGFMVLGMANGLLPCGMVYMALAVTLSFTRVYHSIGFMSGFGAGTLPAMMMVGYGGRFIHPSMRVLFRKSIPFFITATGILLILRGLNLGILFISPALPQAAGQAVNCVH